jgi:hypothetical protein
MLKSLPSILTTFVAVAVLCLSGFADDSQVDEYQMAVSDFYEVALENVIQAMDDGIPEEELPVLFFITTQAEVTSISVINSRLEGESWTDIAAAHDLTAADFYVPVSGERHGARYSKILAKYANRPRSEFDQVSLTDSDIIALVNLRFLYKHYNYSQHLIMTWSGEGKSFVDINRQVYAATTEMKNTHLAGNNE